VLDLYPEKPRDPLLALVQPAPTPSARSRTRRSSKLAPAAPAMEPAVPDLPVVKPDPGKPPAARPADKGKAPRVEQRLVTVVTRPRGNGGEDRARAAGGERTRRT